jgi:excisionase family DNA binding protein
MARKLVRKPDPEPEPLLYSAEQAAKILGGLSVAMIYRYVEQKKLRPVKVGRRTMFTREELERFVRARQAKAKGG